MNAKTVCSILSGLLASAGFSATTYTDWYYVGDGTAWDGAYYSATKGGAGQTVNWGATDRIVLTANQTVFVTDATIGFFAQVGGGVRIDGTNVAVNVDLQTDAVFGTYIGTLTGSAKDGSRIIKTGPGKLSFTKTGDYKVGNQDVFAYAIGFDIRGGSVQLQPSYGSGWRHNHGDVTVAEGCEFLGVPGGITCLPTLAGAGTVRGDGGELRVTATRATPTVFSGYLTGFNTVVPVGHTYFTGLTNDFPNLQPYNYNGEKTHGIIGFATCVGADGAVSSLGTMKQYGVDLRNGPTCLRYLGTTGETFERMVNFFANSTKAGPFVLDAGEYGGLNVTGWLYNNSAFQQVAVLAADKTAATSVFSGKVNRKTTEAGNGASFRLIKQGQGTWRKVENSADEMTGGFDVEEGTLEYESIRDAGLKSSLGKATDLYVPAWGSPDTLEKSPYAHILGGTGEEAVFSYLGTCPRTITTRPIALAGNARLKAPNTVAFRWQGITGTTAGEKTLTVETVAGQTNTLADVTDGTVGQVSVAHEGAGELVLTGNNGFTGDLTAKSGTLTVRNVNGRPYSWYKLTIRETVRNNTTCPEYQDATWKEYGHMALDEWALYDANGARQNQSGNYMAQATAEHIELLEPLQIAAVNHDSVQYYQNTYQFWPGQLVNNSHTSGYICQGYMKSTGPARDDPQSWLSFVQRLPATAPTVTGCDLRLVAYPALGREFGATPTAYTIYGSSDGMVWEEVASTNDWVNLPTTYYYWATAQKYETRAATDPVIPFSRTAMKSDYANCAAVRSVSAAPGATVRCEGSAITVKGLRLDASGAGTIDGFALADEGEIVVENAADPSKELKISATFANMSDLTKLSGWSVRINGTVKNRTVTATPTGITISPKGMSIIVR